MPGENTNTRRVDGWDALRALFRFAVFVLIVACIAVVAVVVALIHEGYGSANVALAPILTNALNGLGNVISPLIQLFVVLVIIEWFLKRMGITLGSSATWKGIEWNTQTIIAVIVIFAFSIAALGGLTEGLGALKDVALVVVGFYFGTQKRMVEIETERGKIKEVIEHDNPVVPREQDQQRSRSSEQPPANQKPPGEGEPS